MKILADENIPNVVQSFSGLGEVQTASGREINAEMLAGVDVLLTRSITKIDEQLLAGSQVKFVGSATTGTDHVDKSYLDHVGIYFTHAHGANARSVTEYVLAVLAQLRLARQIDFFEKTVGVIGLGKVGGGLYNALSDIGVNCIGFDPLIPQDAYTNMVGLNEVLQADIICVHTPLTQEGSHPTVHLLAEEQLAKLKPDAILINAGRGEVVDNNALLQNYDTNPSFIAVLDVWENEPKISQNLLAKIEIATPHIAGYSFDGKIRATQILKSAFCEFFNLDIPADNSVELSDMEIELDTSGDAKDVVCHAILAAYPVMKDDADLRKVQGVGEKDCAQNFDALRKNYWQRREFSQHRISLANDCPGATRRMLAAAGFTLTTKGF